MRSLLYDEIRPPDLEKLRQALGERLVPASVDDVFWLDLPARALTAEQAAHAGSCGPHRLAVVLDEESVRAELLVRAAQNMRCTCIGYATADQRAWALDWLDALMTELGVTT